MGNYSVYGMYKGKQVRLTVFRLNSKVGLALDQEPIWVDPDIAYNLADQLLDQADSILYPSVEREFGIIPLGTELEQSLKEAGKDCLDI